RVERQRVVVEGAGADLELDPVELLDRGLADLECGDFEGAVADREELAEVLIIPDLLRLRHGPAGRKDPVPPEDFRDGPVRVRAVARPANRERRAFLR